ncbi:TetR/AcrR family transcriptional regulator [Fructilactobacillus frigidiflavus]|uniref:TetR/AcrR family transcriptional regulator n=1 Tax=Fructilactobacillus frigidiflavus TaxID=3242688 RepID=UPI003757BB48
MKNSKETRTKILKAAKELFSENGVENTSVRDIAKKSDCSHTTIYLYFKDKDELFNEIAYEPLQKLYEELNMINNSAADSSEKFKSICLSYVKFGLKQKQFYPLLSTFNGEKIDKDDFKHQVNIVRVKILKIIKESIIEILPNDIKDDETLSLTRGIFYFLHGTVMTYVTSHESLDKFMPRVEKTVNDFIDFSILSKRGPY